MTRRPEGALWILLVLPAGATWADVLVPGPPSTAGRDFGMSIALFAAGAFGLAILRRMRNGGADSPLPPRARVRAKALRVVCWLLLLGGPAFYVIRASAVAAEHRKVLRTMADIRQIATGWEAGVVDLQQPRSAGGGITFLERNASAPTVLPYVVTSEQMASVLVPRYMKSFPMRDAWGNEWLLAVDQPWRPGELPAGAYAIASPGRDGRFGPPTNGNVPCGAWECDIVFSNGQFVTRFPAGDPR